MIIGSTKRCHRCGTSYAAGCVVEWPPTCDECSIEVYHILQQVPGTEEVESACGAHKGWPHMWPKGHDYISRARIANLDMTRLCKECQAKSIHPEPTGVD